MPRELVEDKEQVPVVVHMVDTDLVPGLAMAPALVRVVRQQPLVAMAMPKLTAWVGVRAQVLVPMALAEKEPERAVVKEMVRVT